LILRGGRNGPNFAPEKIAEAVAVLRRAALRPQLVVDCAHANSAKKFQNQAIVWRSVLAQRGAGNETVIGMMIESNLHEGSQPLASDARQLRYGVSITDECIGWDETEALLRAAHAAG